MSKDDKNQDKKKEQKQEQKVQTDPTVLNSDTKFGGGGNVDEENHSN